METLNVLEKQPKGWTRSLSGKKKVHSITELS